MAEEDLKHLDSMISELYIFIYYFPTLSRMEMLYIYDIISFNYDQPQPHDGELKR